MLHVKKYQNASEGVTLGHIGSVEDVIAARVPPELQRKVFTAQDYQYGFELASPKSLTSMGEALLVNGQCYACSTEPGEDHLKTLSGAQFYTSGMFLVPKGIKPTHTAKGKFTSPVSIKTLYEQLFQAIQQPLAFAGWVTFNPLLSMSITKAPIDGRNIFEHKQAYYTEPMQKTEQPQHAFIMGAVTDFGRQDLKEVNTKLSVVLYHNPFDQQTGLATHAHAVLLNESVAQVEALTPDKVERVAHVLENGSGVDKCDLQVFSIADLQACG